MKEEKKKRSKRGEITTNTKIQKNKKPKKHTTNNYMSRNWTT